MQKWFPMEMWSSVKPTIPPINQLRIVNFCSKAIKFSLRSFQRIFLDERIQSFEFLLEILQQLLEKCRLIFQEVAFFTKIVFNKNVVFRQTHHSINQSIAHCEFLLKSKKSFRFALFSEFSLMKESKALNFFSKYYSSCWKNAG